MLYKDLEVWQKAMELSVEIYRLTKNFPQEERFGLVNQMRRAVVSIASNIAEGQGRIYTKEYLHFLSVARGSQAEVDTQLLLAVRLGYLCEEEAHRAFELLSMTAKLLNGTIRSVRAKIEFEMNRRL